MGSAEWFKIAAGKRLTRRYKEPLGAIYVHSTEPTLFDELVNLLPEKEIDADDRWEDRWGDGEPPKDRRGN